MSDHCHVDPIEKTVAAEELENNVIVYLAISGMGCPRCALRVRNSLLTVYGVSDAYVDHVGGMGKVLFASKLTTVETIVDAVAQAGNDGRHEYRALPLWPSQND